MARQSGLVSALRCLVHQAGGCSLRPAGSLIIAEPSVSGSDMGSNVGLLGSRYLRAPPASAPPSAPPGSRAMSRASFFPAGFDPWSWFDYRKLVYPDVYDPQEALLVSRYKGHGVVAERYVPPKPVTHWNPLADPELDRRTKYFNKRLYTSWVCYRSLWGFSKPGLQAHILAAYTAVNGALATGDLAAAAPYVSEQMLQRLGGEVARRGRGARVEWRLVGEPGPKDVRLVAGCVVANPMKQGRLAFVQWTAAVSTRQVVAVYDARGNLLAGDPHRELSVVDYWVFERPILKAALVPRPGPQGATWRLVERL